MSDYLIVDLDFDNTQNSNAANQFIEKWKIPLEIKTKANALLALDLPYRISI